MMNRLSLVVGLLVLAGCASQPPAPVPPAPPAPAPAPGAESLPVPGPAPSAELPPDLPAERLRGVYSKSAGWMLCGAASAAPVAADSAVRAELDGFAPGEDAYFLDGWGRVSAQGGIELESIERMHTEGPDCSEPLDGFVWVAHGQEPFWAFGITTQGIRFKPLNAQARVFPYVPPQAEGSQVVYRGADFELRLYKQVCHGTMATARYAWQAQLQTPDGAWQGCAWQGMQSEGQAALP
ncbi:hypothetical protein V8Z80_08670 [Orrella sp. JC864]|uniref:COG3650 family protein n=1 Tax=Orrella sp. JC864 TaxID=3120298 RepID=UPI0012BB7068